MVLMKFFLMISIRNVKIFIYFNVYIKFGVYTANPTGFVGIS